MRLFGHPLHAQLVAFPIALLVLSPFWDVLGWLGVAGAPRVAQLGQIVGLSVGLAAVVSGFAELVRRQPAEGALALALRHAALALSALAVFGLALALRPRDLACGPALFGLECVGSLILGAAGWLGGQLVFGLGVGVGALDAKKDHGP